MSLCDDESGSSEGTLDSAKSLQMSEFLMDVMETRQQVEEESDLSLLSELGSHNDTEIKQIEQELTDVFPAYIKSTGKVNRDSVQHCVVKLGYLEKIKTALRNKTALL